MGGDADLRWEYGSDYHFIGDFSGVSQPAWVSRCVLTYSGRTALLLLLRHLVETGGFLKASGTVWFPAYTCDQVSEPLLHGNYKIDFYDGSPVSPWIIPLDRIRPGDIVVFNNYFGSFLPGTEYYQALKSKGILIIEDHSQAPVGELAVTSQADYAFASLRKTLPLTDGGFLWSPRNCSLPKVPPAGPVPLARIAAMLGKASYLRNEPVYKPDFRAWYALAEQQLAETEICGMSNFAERFLLNFNISAWQKRRHSNLKWLVNHVPPSKRFQVAGEYEHPDSMGLVLYCISNTFRNKMRAFLAAHNIYTAVLWPLPSGASENKFPLAHDFMSRMIFLPTDARYDENDLCKIVKKIRIVEMKV